MSAAVLADKFWRVRRNAYYFNRVSTRLILIEYRGGVSTLCTRAISPVCSQQALFRRTRCNPRSLASREAVVVRLDNVKGHTGGP